MKRVAGKEVRKREDGVVITDGCSLMSFAVRCASFSPPSFRGVFADRDVLYAVD